MPMKQPNTDFGAKSGETGEKIPKRGTSSDTSGERKNAVPKADREKFTPNESDERISMKTKGADGTGERREGLKGGVGQGKADALFNTGKTAGTCYSHKRAR